jgi:predicted dehydrogenase
VRAAVLGCGAIGAGTGAPSHLDVGVMTHVGAYRACPDTDLVAVCDPDPVRAASVGVAAFTDPEELLTQAAPELVSVATPDPTHEALLERCLRADGVRGVLAEKPLALDARAARRLVTLARDRGIVLAVNYSRRYSPVLQRLDIAALGRLQHVTGAYVKGLAHNGTHWLDLLRMLAGEPEAVRGWDRLSEPGPDPTLDAELRLANGAGARLAGLDTTAFTVFEMELTGTRGRVRIAESGHVVERFTVADDPRHPGYRVLMRTERFEGALRDGTLHAVTDLVRAVRDAGEPACRGEDGVAALELAEAIRASTARGGELLRCRHD